MNKRYAVTYGETHVFTVIVDASNEDEAREIIASGNGPTPGQPDDITTDMEDWSIEEVMDGEIGICSACGSLLASGESVKDETTGAEDFHCFTCIDKVTDPIREVA